MENIDNGAVIGLMKFFSCRKYAEDLLKGKLYCHESGWYRKLEDNFRGDKHDGKRPINIDGKVIEIGDVRGIGSGVAVGGFTGDDKIPLYCLSIIDINILDKVSDTTYNFKPTFVEKMKAFGTYVVLLTSYDKFIDTVTSYASTNQLAVSYFPVEYVDIMNEYSIGNGRIRSLEPFFVKDKDKYGYQNEFRLLWQRKDGIPLIDSSKDNIMIDIGYPLSGNVVLADALADTPFIFKDS